MKSLACLFSFILFTSFSFAQNPDAINVQQNTKWQSVINESVYVASTVRAHEGINAKDRVVLDAALPEGTIGYALRVTVNSKHNSSNSLIGLLGNIPSPEIQAASMVSNLILNGVGNQCNVHMFTNRTAARKFELKQAGGYACKTYNQVSSISNYETSCLNTLLIGLQNNNMLTALNVKVELVALVRTQ